MAHAAFGSIFSQTESKDTYIKRKQYDQVRLPCVNIVQLARALCICRALLRSNAPPLSLSLIDPRLLLNPRLSFYIFCWSSCALLCLLLYSHLRLFPVHLFRLPLSLLPTCSTLLLLLMNIVLFQTLLVLYSFYTIHPPPFLLKFPPPLSSPVCNVILQVDREHGERVAAATVELG